MWPDLRTQHGKFGIAQHGRKGGFVFGSFLHFFETQHKVIDGDEQEVNQHPG